MYFYTKIIHGFSSCGYIVLQLSIRNIRMSNDDSCKIIKIIIIYIFLLSTILVE